MPAHEAETIAQCYQAWLDACQVAHGAEVALEQAERASDSADMEVRCTAEKLRALLGDRHVLVGDKLVTTQVDRDRGVTTVSSKSVVLVPSAEAGDVGEIHERAENRAYFRRVQRQSSA